MPIKRKGRRPCGARPCTSFKWQASQAIGLFWKFMPDASTNVRELMIARRANLLEQIATLGHEVAAVEREIAEWDKHQAQLAEIAAKYSGAPASRDPNAALFSLTAAGMNITINQRAPVPTISHLIRAYLTLPDSPYKKLKHNSRQLYDSLLKLVSEDYGSIRLTDIKPETLDAWHAAWSEGGKKLAIAHSKIGMVRNLCGFGTQMLNDAECGRLFGVLAKKRYPLPQARTERLTVEQANLIRAKAREFGRPSIALAQAFQSELGMLQKDVIGEWVPLSDPGESVITSGGFKWLRGLVWEEIDAEARLVHGSFNVELTKHPMIMHEMNLRPSRSEKGPVIVSEMDGLPWDAVEFRRWWRRVADACGIPKNVRSMDSRPKSGAPEEEELELDEVLAAS
jgi:hypothetical protein